MNWIALCHERHFTKMWVAFFEDEWLAISLEEFGITVLLNADGGFWQVCLLLAFLKSGPQKRSPRVRA